MDGTHWYLQRRSEDCSMKLKFKSTDAAFEYAQEYFIKTELNTQSSFIGIVRFVDNEKEPATYLLEIVCRAGNFFKRQNTKTVTAVKHPDLKMEINANDLVVFAPLNISLKMPAGYLLYKLHPELNDQSTQFEKHIEKFKVFVDDHFHYMRKDERYLYGEFESKEEAVSKCKVIIDQSLKSLLENCSLEELKENYYMYGEDPFIEGADFSASQYAEAKIQELISISKEFENGLKLWKHEIDYKYGLLLVESEMLEGEGFIHFCQTDRKKLCASWDIKNKTWQVNVDRSLLEGLSYSTPKRFNQIVFGEETNQSGYYLKQNLVEYLLFGLEVGEIKTLTKEVDNGAKVEFSLDARSWNEMLIGNSVGIENGMCKYFESNCTDERILHFGMMCKEGEVKLELVFDAYENYEQLDFRIKDFGGYYN